MVTRSRARRASMNKLNAKQLRFVEEFMLDLNATRAAVRAGYSEKTAHSCGPRLLGHAGVASAIAAAKKARAEATKIDSHWVLQQAVELHRRCMQEVKPALHPKTRKQMKDSGGNLIYNFNAAAATRALELVGKHVEIGAFRDRLEITSEMSLVERLQQGRARSRMAHLGKVIEGEFEHVEPAGELPRPKEGPTWDVAPGLKPKPGEAQPEPAQVKPGPSQVKPEPGEAKPEPAPAQPKPSPAQPELKAPADAEDLPDGQWRDATGLLRTRDGRRVGAAEQERERLDEAAEG